MGSADSLRGVAARGVLWTGIGFGGTYALRLGSTLFLTRLLTPDVFGLMALASVVSIALNMFSDVGTVPSVVRSKRGDDPDFLCTAWSIQATRGLIIGGLLIALSWPISLLYKQPELFPLLCGLAIMPAVQGFNSIGIAQAQRRMDLRRVIQLNFFSQLVTTAMNILFAWALGSVWALVIGGVIGAVFWLVMSYVWLPGVRPRFSFEPEAMAEIVRFGRWILLSTLFTYFGGQGLNMVMGLLVPIATLGLISIATNISWSLVDLVGKMQSQVAFPTMSRIHRERPADLPAAVARIKRLFFAAVVPGFLLLSLVSEPLINALYDHRYAEAGKFMHYLALNGAISTLVLPYQNLLLVLGQGRPYSILMGTNAIARVLGVLVGFWLGGIYGLIVGIGMGALMSYLIGVFFARRNGIRSQGADLIALAAIVLCGTFDLFFTLG